jgi:hypothetical protein
MEPLDAVVEAVSIGKALGATGKRLRILPFSVGGTA